jgi:hypothetical protein
MKIILDVRNYTNFEYSPYLGRGSQIETPKNPNYVVGQLVAVSREIGIEELAVVLGCIDEDFDGELRLDLCGMTAIEDIRPANVTDFGKSNVTYSDKIYKECKGEAVVSFGGVGSAGEDRQESLWYDGEIARVTKGNKTFAIDSTGEIELVIDLNGGGDFDDSPTLKGQDARSACISHNFGDEDLLNEDKVSFLMSSWFAVRLLDEDGDAVDDIAVCHTYDEAIQIALDQMDNPSTDFLVKDK